MGKINWNIDEMLSVDENIIYSCDIEDEERDSIINVFLTNYRLIWIDGDMVDCRLLKFISKYGVFVGYDEYSEDWDFGTGEYGIYFGDTTAYQSMWFYSKEIWKTFYAELSRSILETE